MNFADYEINAAPSDERRALAADLKQRFASDLALEFGVENHPKADLLFAKAWELGHSNGYQEVYHHYEDLVELIR